MFAVFQKEPVITACIVATFLLSLFVRLFLGGLYKRLIRESDNLASTQDKQLRQCKLKYTNCYQLNRGVPNTSVFVDKFLSRLSAGPFSLEFLYHLSGQLMLLSVVFAGVGACKGIAAGRLVGEIVPFYLLSFLELYLFFSVGSLVDIKGYRRTLKVSLVDYLENHLSARISVTQKDVEKLCGKPLERRQNVGKAKDAAGVQEGFTKEQEEELESLLTEFLTS